jgi:hypothetical protein
MGIEEGEEGGTQAGEVDTAEPSNREEEEEAGTPNDGGKRKRKPNVRYMSSPSTKKAKRAGRPKKKEATT